MRHRGAPRGRGFFHYVDDGEIFVAGGASHLVRDKIEDSPRVVEKRPQPLESLMSQMEKTVNCRLISPRFDD